MTRIIFLVCFLAFRANISFSQYIGEVYTFPEVLKSNSDFKIIANITTPNQGTFLSKESNIIGDTIFIYSCYFTGYATSPKAFSDTFEIKSLKPGNYMVKYEHSLSNDPSNSCVKWRTKIKTKSIQILDVVTTNVVDISYPFKVYPNPVFNILYFKEVKANRIKVFDLLGQVVIDKQSFSLINQVDCSDLETGIYIVEVIDLSGGVARVKIVKD